MPSSLEEKDFIASVIDTSLLDQTLEWIRANMSPEDVFTDDSVLQTWAEDNGYVEEE